MLLLPLLALTLSPIQIDGSFSDWPEGITVQEDAYFEYALVTLPEKACLQQLPEQKIIELGAYTIFFSPKGKGYGVSCKRGDDWISPYEAGVLFAPTTVSTTFEVRVSKASPEADPNSFSFNKEGDFRVVCWNVHFGSLLEKKELASRMLKALEPDVLLLQELDGDDTTEELTKFLEEALSSTWIVRSNESSGEKPQRRLKCAIATSTPSLQSFQIGEPPLKAIGAITSFEEKPINFVSLHLRCCGGPNSEAEHQRQEEARAIHNTIDNMQSPRFVIAGDWNLVGTTKPLEIVKGEMFQSVEAFQPDGRVMATWSDATSSFTPGRLDWMLYSPQFLQVQKCFVLDSADLDRDTLNAHHLQSDDTANFSDHLPLVADFKVLH